MKIFELFSGFIAAIVIALGAGLYVNQVASVGEELVVEETVKEVVQVERWVKIEFINNNPLEHDNPMNQKIVGMYQAEVEAPCDEESGTICALKLLMDEDIEEEDLEDLTVEDALEDDLVEYTDSTYPEYSYFQ